MYFWRGKSELMNHINKEKALYWFLTAVSTAVMILLFIFKPEWSWVSFPFVGTFLAGALDAI